MLLDMKQSFCTVALAWHWSNQPPNIDLQAQKTRAKLGALPKSNNLHVLQAFARAWADTDR